MVKWDAIHEIHYELKSDREINKLIREYKVDFNDENEENLSVDYIE